MNPPSFEELYDAIARRDAKFDGLWWVAVKTTRIFCRPCCPSRTPLAKNVEFFDSTARALDAGYRACKRCRPLDPSDPIPAELVGLMESVRAQPEHRMTDYDLRQRGLDPVAVRRGFLKHYGATFHQVQRSQRMAAALSTLKGGSTVLETSLETGYESTSAFRERFQNLLGQPPSRAANVEAAAARWLESPLGPLVAIAVDEGVALLEFSDRKSIEKQFKVFAERFGRPVVMGEHAHLSTLETQLAEYFAKQRTEFTVPITSPGTEFQQRVWQLLRQIPYGTTRSYSDLARDLAIPGSSRAVGRANGDNRLAILLPCHRVVRSDGHLCGYAGGLWRKKWLLEHETGIADSLF